MKDIFIKDPEDEDDIYPTFDDDKEIIKGDTDEIDL